MLDEFLGGSMRGRTGSAAGTVQRACGVAKRLALKPCEARAGRVRAGVVQINLNRLALRQELIQPTISFN
jgi:hypothetical protein